MTDLLDAWFKMNVGDGAFYAVFGLVFVAVGIALLVLILMLVGLIMKKTAAKKDEKPAAAQDVGKERPVRENAQDGVTPETVAAIVAALTAFYETENVKCDFVVRRIKRL